MEFDATLLPARREACIAQGLRHDRTINGELDARVAAHPDKLALTALQVESGSIRRFTYRDLSTMADHIAVGLSRLDIGRNDVVALQLPNGPQFTLTYLACSRIGAVLNPLMHIFRERELSFMLQHGEARLIVERLDERERQGFLDQSLLRPLGQPEEVADVVAFLCSDDASFMTGEILAVSGGNHPSL